MKQKIISIILISFIMVQTAKARLLWSNVEPGIDYNDYRICTKGSNKTNVFGSIFNYLNSNDDITWRNKGQIQLADYYKAMADRVRATKTQQIRQ